MNLPNGPLPSVLALGSLFGGKGFGKAALEHQRDVPKAAGKGNGRQEEGWLYGKI